MTVIMFIFTLLFIVVFYFINALINRSDTDHKRIEELEEKVQQLGYEMNDIYSRHNGLRDFTDEINAHVEQDKTNIDACANAILNIRNNIGKLGNRIQKIERKED